MQSRSIVAICSLAAALFTLTLVSAVRAQPAATPAPRSLADWVKKSNQNTKVMVELLAKLQPEAASQLGVEGYDDQISDLSPGFVERQLKAMREVHANLIRRLAGETEPRVKQDLEILIKAAADEIKEAELNERLKVPYFSLDELMFGSFRGLLDDQIAPNRRPAALVRLRKYTASRRAHSRSPNMPSHSSASECPTRGCCRQPSQKLRKISRSRPSSPQA